MAQNPAKIENGSRVAVIGGGPAGVFFALYLLKYARETGVRPEVTVYERRDFREPGPAGCKGCAGILSMSLQRDLNELGLVMPEGIIQRRIDHYTVHTPYNTITLSNPEKDAQIVSVYRGGGPRLGHGVTTTGFDGWLIEQAIKTGVKVKRERVAAIYTGNETGIEVDGERLGFDLVVLASGVNAPLVKISGLDYIPPKTQAMAQDELYAGREAVEARLGNAAHAFLIPRSGFIFGTLVPKGDFINVSVISRGNRPVSVKDFLEYDLVRRALPEKYERACGCRPRSTVSAAGNYFADRFVAVGDAAASRLYKDGVGSALRTAREAAATAVHHGVSREAFKRHYQVFCNAINRDNRWGRQLFALNDRGKDSRLFLLTQHHVIGNEQNNQSFSQPFTRAAWGMFTGSYSYCSIAAMTLNPISLVKLATAASVEGSKSLFQPRTASPRALHVGGKKVLIVGSGFAGTYVLRKLVPALNRNENVETTMVSNENFFLFSPLLHEVAAGRIETRHIAYPIRRLHWRDRFNFVLANVERIDLAARRVITSDGSYGFDYLVLGLGSVTDTSQLEKIREGGTVFSLKTMQDSILIRNHIIKQFELASTESSPQRQKEILTFIVCGGGYTGVQLITELRDFIYQHLLRFYRDIGKNCIRLMLVESDPVIGTELHPKLSAYVNRHLQRSGLEIRLKSKVTRIREGQVEINARETVPASMVVWAAGVVAHPLLAGLGAGHDSIGRVMVNEFLEIPEFRGVYAVGDCAHYKDPETGEPVPPRAHTAVRQAKAVARNLLAEIRGQPCTPYHYTNTAEAVSLGSSDAVVRFMKLRFYGKAARFLWLLGYVYLVTGVPNRLRIIMDWFFSLVFGRDVTYINLPK